MIESPCVKICKLKDDVCIGCGRTKDEIMRWTRMTDAEREEVMQKLRPCSSVD